MNKRKHAQSRKMSIDLEEILHLVCTFAPKDKSLFVEKEVSFVICFYFLFVRRMNISPSTWNPIVWDDGS